LGDLDLQRKGSEIWEGDCISAPGLLGVLGTGPRISDDILELGSYLVGREEQFWEVFRSDQGGKLRTKGGIIASGSGIYLELCTVFVLICY
jgi:hypothetical protein